MKIITYILVIVFVGFAIFILTSDKKVDPVVETTEERALCYAWNTDAGDSAALKMVFTGEGGSQVSGFLNYRPFQKDSKKGVFTGTAGVLDQESMSRTATLLWSAQGEGMMNQEELKIVFGDGSASVLFGEMIDRGDGVYVYKNPESLTPGILLGQTNCQSLEEVLAVESYIRENIKTIATNKPVLGGSWYVTTISVNHSADTATVVYEDGHIQSKAVIGYSYDGKGWVTIKAFTVTE